MKPTRFIALRYLRAKHNYGFVSFIGYLGMIGLAIGVAAMILTLSIMEGFEEAVADKVAGMDGHLRLTNGLGTGTALPDSVYIWLNNQPEVTSVTPYVAGNALVRNGRRSDGLLLLGASWENLAVAIDMETYLIAGDLPAAGDVFSIIIGEKMAQSLRVSVGDEIHLFDINYLLGEQGFRGDRFEVSAIFRSGMSEYDHSLGFLSLTAANNLLGRKEAPGRAIINLTDRNLAADLGARFEAELGFPYFFVSWLDRHAGLFNWLQSQQIPIFIIFGFIGAVALLNIISTLILVVIEKQRDIGILQTIGFSRKQVREVFLIQGLIVGIVGSLMGLVLALVLGYLQMEFHLVSLKSDIYFMDYLPVQWSTGGLVIIPILTVILTVIAALLPARRAAKVIPAEALRYE